MHAPRIPLDFDFHHAGYGRIYFASHETGIFWFGLILAAGMAWNLWLGLREGGDFGHQWFSPPADRDHPVAFWTSVAGHVALLLVGVDFIVAGLIGSKPWIFH